MFPCLVDDTPASEDSEDAEEDAMVTHAAPSKQESVDVGTSDWVEAAANGV